MLHPQAFLADLRFECDDDKCEEVILSYHQTSHHNYSQPRQLSSALKYTFLPPKKDDGDRQTDGSLAIKHKDVLQESKCALYK